MFTVTGAVSEPRVSPWAWSSGKEKLGVTSAVPLVSGFGVILCVAAGVAALALGFDVILGVTSGVAELEDAWEAEASWEAAGLAEPRLPLDPRVATNQAPPATRATMSATTATDGTPLDRVADAAAGGYGPQAPDGAEPAAGVASTGI